MEAERVREREWGRGERGGGVVMTYQGCEKDMM